MRRTDAKADRTAVRAAGPNGRMARAAAWGRGMAAGLVACAALLAGGIARDALAVEAPPAAADPALEARTMKLSAELRCLVCQNQTIADSHAELAVDLRNQVRDMLREGRSEREVLDYMTERYGDFVLYRPPLKGTTAFLWFGPALLLVGGLVVLVTVLRRRNAMPADRFEPEPEELDGGSDAPPASPNEPRAPAPSAPR